jgi:hypothetical protein
VLSLIAKTDDVKENEECTSDSDEVAVLQKGRVNPFELANNEAEARFEYLHLRCVTRGATCGESAIICA